MEIYKEDNVMKKLLAILLAVVLVFGLAACGNTNNNAAPANQGGNQTPSNQGNNAEPEKKTSLRVAIDVEPGSMWFLSGTSSGGGLHVHRQIYDTLIQFGPNFKLLPNMAESWENIEGGYRFHLRKGLKDANGSDITAEDVLFCIGIYKNSGEHQQQVRYIDLEKSYAEDDTTVVIMLNEPNAFQFQNIAKCKIIDKETYEKDPDAFIKNPVGTGPYKVTEYIPGSKIVMTYNEYWWGEEPDIKEITFYVIAEPSQRTNALERGEIDVDMNLQSSDFKYVSDLANCDTLSLESNRAEGMWLNTSENSILNDINLRKAVALAIDNAGIAQAVYGGMYSPAPGACAKSLSDYDPKYDNELYAKQDLDQAKKLVEEAGAKGKTLTILTTGRADQVSAAEMIKTWLTQAGFEVNIQQMEDAVINDALSNPAGGWDIGMTNFRCGSNYMLDMYNAYLSYLNYCAWSGPTYEEFIQTSSRGCNSSDPAEIKECTDKVIQLIQDNVVLYNFAVSQTFIGKAADLNMTPDEVYGFELYAPILSFK